MTVRTACGMTTIEEDALGVKRRVVCRRKLVEIYTHDHRYTLCPTCDRAPATPPADPTPPRS